MGKSTRGVSSGFDAASQPLLQAPHFSWWRRRHHVPVAFPGASFASGGGMTHHGESLCSECITDGDVDARRKAPKPDLPVAFISDIGRTQSSLFSLSLAGRADMQLSPVACVHRCLGSAYSLSALTNVRNSVNPSSPFARFVVHGEGLIPSKLTKKQTNML